LIFSNICQDRASGLEGKYTRAAKNLHQAGDNKVKIKQVLVDLMEYLQKKQPNKQRIKEALKNLEFSNENDNNKKTIQTIFRKIEEHLHNTKELVVGSFSLEHISDQSLNLTWGPGIGNLLPLDESVNNKIKAGTLFKDKKKFYQKSSLRLVEHFLSKNQQESWTKINADAWLNEIGNLAVEAVSLVPIK
jgi:hypothetical protein